MPRALMWCASAMLLMVYAGSAAIEVESVQGGVSRKLLVNPALANTPMGTLRPPHTGLPDDFVQVDNGKFTIGGAPFVFAGWNIWEVLDAASYAPPPFRHLGRDGREMIQKVMSQAVDSGLTVVRMWGHTITPGHALQPSLGNYNETIFEALDFILDEARIRGLKVIVVFADNWYPTGGTMNYVEWKIGPNGTRYDFFTDGGVKQAYKQNILQLLNRKNTKNDRLYKDDPTIMAWNLANEARCDDCDSWVLQSWIDEMAPFVKSHDDRHLIGVGHEGFYGKNSPHVNRNPGAPLSDWASKNGQDFPDNLASSSIDYVGIHVWPDNWLMKTPGFLQQFFRGHVEDSRYLGKPFVLEEFGKIVNATSDEDDMALRDTFFRAAYETAEEYALNDGIVQGTLFWHWYDIDVGPGRYGLWYSDSTFDIVRDHAKKMNGISLAIQK